MSKQVFVEKTKYSHLIKHETKKNVLIKFSLVLLIFLGYFAIIAFKYGVNQGFWVTALSWSFFVLCTPIADAGFLVDFPLRLVTRIRMLFSEMFVWFIAIFLNLYAFFINPDIYQQTKLLSLFKNILEQPIPFWIIIIISATGTFLSIKFGDELLDKARHKDRALYHKHKHSHRFIIMIFLFVFVLIFYRLLLKQLGVDISL